jgi:hypothetical protein
MKGYLILLLSFLTFYSSNSFAQSGEGCLMSDGLVYHPYLYTDLLGLGSRVYSDSNPYLTTGACPGRVNYTLDPAGRRCVNASLLGLISLSERGYIVNYYPCSLDDYSWSLGAAAGLFGILVIRRRNKL